MQIDLWRRQPQVICRHFESVRSSRSSYGRGIAPAAVETFGAATDSKRRVPHPSLAMLNAVVIIVLSYLAGSIPGSLWVGRALNGVDVRQHGSGNMGATNTFRVLGWKAGVLATLIDVGKGLLAAGIIATIRISPDVIELPFWNPDVLYQMVAGIAAVVGHMYPVWANFRGGKGMNTSAGVLFAITPYSMWITVCVFVIVVLVTRYVSLGSLIGAVTFPTTVAIRKYVFGIDRLDASIFVMSLLIAVGLIYAHRTNISRLLSGTGEPNTDLPSGEGHGGSRRAITSNRSYVSESGRGRGNWRGQLWNGARDYSRPGRPHGFPLDQARSRCRVHA